MDKIIVHHVSDSNFNPKQYIEHHFYIDENGVITRPKPNWKPFNSGLNSQMNNKTNGQ